MTDPGTANEPDDRSETGTPRDLSSDLETPEEVRQEAILLERAIGGWRGIIDSGLPTAVFVVAYIVTSRDLRSSLIAAIAGGVIVVLWRLIRREPLGQVLAGFVGLAISAWWASRNDNASDIYIPGMLTNLGYGTAFLVSILVRWPLLGVVMGFLTGEGTTWRQDPVLRRTYAAASWIWVALFFSRLIVQTPMYLAGWVELQGIAKIVMGYPLFLGAAYWTYRVLAPVFRQKRAEREQAIPQDPAPDDQV